MTRHFQSAGNEIIFLQELPAPKVLGHRTAIDRVIRGAFEKIPRPGLRELTVAGVAGASVLALAVNASGARYSNNGPSGSRIEASASDAPDFLCNIAAIDQSGNTVIGKGNCSYNGKPLDDKKNLVWRYSKESFDNTDAPCVIGTGSGAKKQFTIAQIPQRVIGSGPLKGNIRPATTNVKMTLTATINGKKVRATKEKTLSNPNSAVVCSEETVIHDHPEIPPVEAPFTFETPPTFDPKDFTYTAGIIDTGSNGDCYSVRSVPERYSGKYIEGWKTICPKTGTFGMLAFISRYAPPDGSKTCDSTITGVNRYRLSRDIGPGSLYPAGSVITYKKDGLTFDYIPPSATDPTQPYSIVKLSDDWLRLPVNKVPVC